MAIEVLRELVENDVAIRLDLSEQILELVMPDEDRDRGAELSPIPESFSSLVSASVLSQKAKQFDDALYAAVEVAVQRGLGNITSRLDLFRAWATAALDAREHGNAACKLFAACNLGGAHLPLSSEVSAQVQRVIDRFLADEGQSTPLGFYSQTEQLASIFRQNRLLMTELGDPESSDALARLVAGDASLLRAYRSILALAAKMTNPPSADFHDLLRAGDKTARRILVPSRSHEADLVDRLYGGGPIPSGFDLAEELASRVEAGSLSLVPTEDSGWYDHQIWALEPLVAPDRARERTRMRLSSGYRRYLRGLFKGLYAQMKETHLMLIGPPLCGTTTRRSPLRIPVRPDLTAEPLATYYARRARSYSFVRGVLQDAFGSRWRDLVFTDVLTAWNRVDEGLDGMEAIFHGAHVRVCRELGFQNEVTVMPHRNPDSDDASFRTWVGGIERDPDLSRDTRMMVPVFYDPQRQQTKVWVLLGWSSRPLTVQFHRPPRVLEMRSMQRQERPEEPRRRSKKTLDDDAAPEIDFVAANHDVAVPVTAEIYVSRLLDREAFRRLCDERKTRSAILNALTAPK
jgi:hypothetical protein